MGIWVLSVYEFSVYEPLYATVESEKTQKPAQSPKDSWPSDDEINGVA